MTFSFTEKDIDRFVDLVTEAQGPLATKCWLWDGAKSRGQGNKAWYGSFHIGGKTVRAHKFSFVAVGRGRLLPGQQLDHICEIPLCVNPNHLEAVTREQNQERKYRRRYDRRH